MNDEICHTEDNTHHLTVWHPDVHQLYGESLKYYLIASVAYDTWFTLQIEQLLRQYGIKGWCMYELFGLYDILVRAWVDSRQAKQFTEALRNNRTIIDIAEFHVTEVDYLWSDTFQRCPTLPHEILQYLSTKTLTQVQGRKPDGEIISTLMKQGAILKHVTTNTDKAFEGIKFLMCLSFPMPGKTKQSEIKKELKAYLQQMTRPFDEVSLYSGYGFAHFFLKGTTTFDRIYDISDFATSLMSKFRIIHMKTTTNLIASLHAFESDYINFGLGPISTMGGVGIDIMNQLEVSATQLEELGKFERRLLEDRFVDLMASGVLASYKEVLVPLFQAFVKKDEKKIRQELCILLEFERYFRNFCCLIMSDTFGGKWAHSKEFVDLCQSVGITPTEVAKLTLHDWLSLMGKGEAQKRMIVEILGPSWEHIIRTATTLRNQFAHGRMGDTISVWDDIVSFMAEFLPLYNLIKEKASINKE